MPPLYLRKEWVFHTSLPCSKANVRHTRRDRIRFTFGLQAFGRSRIARSWRCLCPGLSWRKERRFLPLTSQPLAVRWLMENGPKELEMLFRAIIFQPSAPILLADDDRRYCEASVGAGRLLGLSREEIIGRTLDDFTEPSLRPVISEHWTRFLADGQQEGTLTLLGSEGIPRNVKYSAKGNVGPVRHLLLLHDKTVPTGGTPRKNASKGSVSARAQDYALSLLDADGQIVAWYGGAERIYGYQRRDLIGQNISILYPEEGVPADLQEELKRAAFEGHTGMECWHAKKGGTRFWANVITMALKDENGQLQGFARVVRDFSDRHQRDENLRQGGPRLGMLPAAATIAGIVSGEFDRIVEANDAFLSLVGFTREDVQAGRLRWHDLTPPDFFALDDLAHEEELRFGACTPFEKELIRKDGTPGLGSHRHSHPEALSFPMDHIRARPPGAPPAGKYL